MDNKSPKKTDTSPSRKKKSSPLPPPPKFHSTTERLPVLESAPPSASTSFSSSLPAPSNAATSSLADLPPPPKMTGVVSNNLASPTVVQVPPPPVVGAAATMASIPPPPPPPVVAPLVVSPPPPPPMAVEQPQQEIPASPQPSRPLKEETPPPSRLSKISSDFSLLSRAQSRIPILVIATEAAHKLAWKNKLQLVDLLGGLSQQSLENETVPLPPFRSVHRSMLLHWEHLHLDFMDPSDFDNNNKKQQEESSTMENLLNKCARMDPTEDDFESHVQGMLELHNDTTTTTTSSSSSDTMNVVHYNKLQNVSENAYALTSPPDAPWLNRFRAALQEGAMQQAPPLVLLVCSSNDFASPIDCLRELSSPHFLPSPFHNGILDKSTLRAEAVVLHDVVDGGELQEVQLKQQLNQHFGGGAAILKINSILPETAARMNVEENETNVWGDVTRGRCLSATDQAVLRRYLATMITSSLLPALERRISDLNFIVTDRKKGVKNVFKALWRKPKEGETTSTSSSGGGTPQKQQAMETTETSSNTTNSTKSTVKYRCDSIEAQVRLLADTLFLVRDWDAALSMYRLIKDDYKADKAMLEYGAVNEMMALATYSMDPVGRAQETFSYMETALFSYTRAAEEERGGGTPMARPSQASPATQLATRLCLIMACASEVIQDRPLEVADLLASASSHETPLGAAVLLEQSSAHYYRAGMYRKYAFHMLMSGHMFRSALQEHHAFRCFTSSLYIYHDGRWDELHNHLRSALAAQLYSLGKMSESVELYAKLVGTYSGGRVSIRSQQKFVQHLQEICQNYTQEAMVGADRMIANDPKRTERLQDIHGATRVLELTNMDLPAVDDSTVQVNVESEHMQEHNIPSFGTLDDGDPIVWDELKCEAEAELKAIDPSIVIGDGSPTLAKIEDPLIRRVVAAIDKEKTSQNLKQKAKRSGNYKEKPAVRACMEPLSVEFVMKNPLSIPIEIEALQLVAKMTEAGSRRICTNEDAILLDGPPSKSVRTWTFSGSPNVLYEAPEFCRISGTSSGTWKSFTEEEPFFVVTKYAVALSPNSTVRVTLGICPLVLGDLEVLGMRCKLFNDIWVYHPFDVKGPLLQNTSENRANRVRAESILLKARIEQGMPSLAANLIPKRDGSGEGPMLVGQMSSWILRLANSGTAPATNISLKTNLPWINVESTNGPLSSGQPTPHCIGPSGTLSELPLNDASLNTRGVLQPGESIDIPVIIRSSDGGNHSFYMLYRYELWDPSSSASSPKRRWLHNMFNVPASPSLTLTASLMPSFWKQHEYILSVEVTNYRSDNSSDLDITLDKLCILSRHYRMELLEGQLGMTTNSDASPFRLGWQERVTLHYRVIPLDEAAAGCILSECHFAEGQVEMAEYLAGPTTNYLCIEHAQHEFQDVLRSHQIELARAAAAEESGGHPRSIAQIRRAKSSLSGVESIADTDDEESDLLSGEESGMSHPTSIARLCPPDSSKAKLNMVCTWSATGTGGRTDIVHGQHHFTRLSVRPTTSTRGCPITITCRHPTQLSHDFDKGPLSIPFEVILRNRLVDAGVFFEFSVQRPKGFEFIGIESFQWALEGGEELTVPIQAVVPKGGVYNLQCVRLTVTKTEKKVPYLFPLQWIVRVNA